MIEQKEKVRRGCLVYTLVVVSVLFLVVLAGGLVGLKCFKHMLDDYTSTIHSPVPVVELSSEELKALQTRIRDFRVSLGGGHTAQPLELSDREINGLIAAEPELDAVKGKLFITIDDGHIRGKISAPLEQLNLAVFKGRYLNGEAEFDLSFANGTLRLSPRSITVRGRPIPEVYQESISRQNLARDLNSNAEAAEVLQHLDKVYLHGDKVVLVPATGSK